MIITVIHGVKHKGITYSMTKAVLDKLGNDNEVHEYFMPDDAPDYCVGCYNCFLKGEEYCPSAQKVQPIMKDIEQSDLIILDSSCYCLEMIGALKNLMDHFAYRWVTHRPDGRMYSKIGLTVSSSAGAPPKSVTRSMARQLKWMGVAKRYQFPLASMAENVTKLSDKKKLEIEKTAEKIAYKIKSVKSKPSIVTKMMFCMFRAMQKNDKTAWNPTDRDWWKNSGFLDGKKPWKN